MRNMKLLIVDDSKLLLDKLSDFFSKCDFVSKVFKSTNVETGKSILDEEDIDVVLTDIEMPGVNGFELLAYIKKKYPEIKIVMITNYYYSQYRQKAESMGADYFISKTGDFNQLVQLLEGI